MTELGAEINFGGKGNFANFNKNNPINCDKQERTNGQNQSLIHLKPKLSKLPNRVGVGAFLN